ncbi:DEAD/DEAH box helicase [Halostella pelagica]|uniref:DEAD/DEAH box helicase n=1 Tax=Halostella pelagica TaxID=2583824 RepID=UPI00108226F7|nr:DEAD/DEAH box helicase [Halostella pelagica]
MTDDNATAADETAGWSERVDVLSPERLRDRFPEYEGQIAHTAAQPAEDADYVDAASVLGDALAAELGHDLYEHQAEAIERLLDGENVAVATATSSGKTFVYALYFALLKRENPDARALFCFPTKALSRDQEGALNDLYGDLGLDVTVAVYDGDTPRDRRRAIRESADVIVSNFAGINVYLGHHRKWRDCLANCELLAVDESHSYTGVHGMHVAWTLRRLRRVLDYYGSDPSLVCTTATIGNPADHAEALTGEPFSVVDEDGSPHGRREIVFWDPPFDEDPAEEYDIEEFLGAKRSANSEASDVLAHLGLNGVQTLLFARSRQGTELAAKAAERAAGDHPAGGYLSVEPYHAGHGKESRRSTEYRLKSGDLDGVVSTNALELGIDVGSVDAAVVAGYPGTRQSFWQQVGRAGRGTADALAVLVAHADAIDQYVLDNPDYLLGDAMEDAVVDLENNAVYARHLLCAADELPLTRNDSRWFDGEDRLERGVEMWKDAGRFVGHLDHGVQYDGPPRPQADISMYATSGEQFDVRCEDGEIEMEPIDRERAYRDFHPGALTLHDGTEYEVVELEEDVPRPYVTVREARTNEYTRTLSEKSVSDLDRRRERDLGDGFTLCFGTGTVSIHYSHYKRIEIETGRTKGAPEPTGLPPIELRTQLMWVETPRSLFETVVEDVPDELLAEPSASASLGTKEWTFLGGLHGAEHAMIKLAPLELRMDKGDMGGLSINRHPETDVPTWFIHDTVEGGIGFAKGIYENVESVLERTRERVADCDCGGVNGCPACLMDVQCGNGNEPLHAPATVRIVDAVLDQFD